MEHFPLTHQNENNIAYKCKANENLIRKEAILNCFQSEIKQATNKFSDEQNHKGKVTAKQLFELFYFFATEINRTPRSLL